MRLERLARYAGRPPLAAERLSVLDDGRLLYRLKQRWRDGTTHVIYEPLELIERLAALVPPPRLNRTGIPECCGADRGLQADDRTPAGGSGRFCCSASYGLSGSIGEDRIEQGRGAGRGLSEKLRMGPADGPGLRIGCACVSPVRRADEDGGCN